MIIFNLYTPTSYLTFKVQSNISLRILCPNLNSLGEVPHQNWGTAEWKQWRYDQIEFNSNFSYKICTQFAKILLLSHILQWDLCIKLFYSPAAPADLSAKPKIIAPSLQLFAFLNTKKRSRDKVFGFWKSKFYNT